jgi:hypothetical protein
MSGGGARFATYDVPSIRVNFSRATVAEQSNAAHELPEAAEHGAWSVADEDGVVRVGELGHMSRVMCVAVAPRSACMVATGDVHGVVTLWHAQSGRELFRVALCVDDARRTFSCTDVQWSGDESVVVVGGVAGLRSVWSRVDDACAVTVAPIVVVDVASGTVACQLDDGHASEVWSVRCVDVCGLRCVVSAGEDGRVLRWQLAADYAALVKKTVLVDEDLAANAAFCIAFVPDCANKYALVATDNSLTLFDVQHCFAVQRFNNLYSHMCSFVAFLPSASVRLPLDATATTAADDDASAGRRVRRCAPFEWFLVTAGLEATDDYAQKLSKAAAAVPLNERPPPNPVRPSCAHMRRLSAPSTTEGDWTLEEVHEYAPHGYEATHFPMRMFGDSLHLYLPCDSGHVVVVDTDAPVLARHDANFVDLTPLIGSDAVRANERHALHRQAARLARTPYAAVRTGTAVRGILKPPNPTGEPVHDIAGNALLQRLYVAQGKSVAVFERAPTH